MPSDKPYENVDYSKFIDNDRASAQVESVSEKLLRETQLIGTGLTGIGDGLREASNDPLGTAARVAVPLGVGILASRYGAAEGFASQALRCGLGASALSFGADVMLKADEVGSALRDTWNTSENWDANSQVMKQNLGRFVVDTALMTGAGLAGSRIGAAMRPWNSPFHENFVLSRSDAHIVDNGISKSIAWDVNPRTGWHASIYSPAEIRALSLETGLTGPSLQRIGSMPVEMLHQTRLATMRAEGPSPVTDVLSMTETLRTHGTLSDYHGLTHGLWRSSRENFATRAVPRFGPL